MAVKAWWIWGLGAIGIAIVALLALIAYALLSDEGRGPAAQVAQPTESATPSPSPTAAPQATPTAGLPTAIGHNGELRLGDTATIGDVKVTVKSVTYGLSECEQLLQPAPGERLAVDAGYEVICLEYDEDLTAVLAETPTATPSKRYETKLLDSAGEENGRGVFVVGVTPDGMCHSTDTYAYRQGRRAVAFIYRDLWTGEEARWSLE
jgi:hypothetical protein